MIPMIAEWAISTIKDQATVQRTRARKDSASDFGQYSCVHAKHMGHLVLGNTDVRFETSVRSAEHWKLSYESILRMEKVHHSCPNFIEDEENSIKFRFRLRG